MKKIIIGLLASCFLYTSCDLDTYPDDKITTKDIEEIEDFSIYATNGNYAMFKDVLNFDNQKYTGNTYVRHFTQMTEYPSDNICLSGRTSDPLYEANTYQRNAGLLNVRYLWYNMYKVINGSSAIIESIDDGKATPMMLHVKGENLTLRAFAHLHLSMLWSRPYSHGRENMGVVLVTSPQPPAPKRATVGEVYDQIVRDLEDAIKYLDHGERRGNAAYISKATAQGLLSRVHLYMGENDKVIKVVDSMLAGADAISKLEPTESFDQYFATALDKNETLWAVGHDKEDSKGTSSIASMYINVDGVGWGEVYASDTYMDLLQRYPQDRRNAFVEPQYHKDNILTVRWAVATSDGTYTNQIEKVDFDSANNKYYFVKDGAKVYVEKEVVNTYDQNFITLNGDKHRARLSKKMEVRNGFPKYFVNKFSNQLGDPMLSSPVMLRWAEVILNRAEAYAKTNQPAKALDDVNTIRKRAGLSGGALFSTSNMHGYADALSVVLDERRLEFAFEGLRMHDVYRNKLSMNRQYAGVQQWEEISYEDNKTVYLISSTEIGTSHLPQNP